MVQKELPKRLLGLTLHLFGEPRGSSRFAREAHPHQKLRKILHRLRRRPKERFLADSSSHSLGGP